MSSGPLPTHIEGELTNTDTNTSSPSSSLSPSFTDDTTILDADFWLHTLDQTDSTSGISWESEFDAPAAAANLVGVLGADHPTDSTALPSVPAEMSTDAEASATLNLALSPLDGQTLEDQLMSIFNDMVDEFGATSDQPSIMDAQVTTPVWPWASKETTAPSSIAIF